MSDHQYSDGRCLFCHKTPEQNRSTPNCVTRDHVLTGDMSKFKGAIVMSSDTPLRQVLMQMTDLGMTFAEIPYGPIIVTINLVISEKAGEFREICRKFTEAQ